MITSGNVMRIILEELYLFHNFHSSFSQCLSMRFLGTSQKFLNDVSMNGFIRNPVPSDNQISYIPRSSVPKPNTLSMNHVKWSSSQVLCLKLLPDCRLIKVTAGVGLEEIG